MKLKRFLLRYYPPGIILEYEKAGKFNTKSIDLLDLSPGCDTEKLIDMIKETEPLITNSCIPQLKHLLSRLQEKLNQPDNHRFSLFKKLQAHILPLTNVAFNKSGTRFITASYDRTCKIWDTASGEEIHTLVGHRNVVYAISFNNPYGDKIATGSFDKTCKLWSTETGKCYYTFHGHTAEIVCLAFNPQSTMIATGSMDTTARLWDISTGEEMATLVEWKLILILCPTGMFKTHLGHRGIVHAASVVPTVKPAGGSVLGHSAEIISLSFNTVGNQLVTGSFDHTVSLWDIPSGRLVYTLTGHRGEISSVQFNWSGSLIATGSMDKTCKVWNTLNGKCVTTLTGHKDEVLDVCFNYTGQLIATASADETARVHSAASGECIAKLEGHEGEISKICFNPQGTQVLTASSDKTARLWDVASGSCLQVLQGHTDEIFSSTFNYEGDIIITGSKDNTCQIWR